MILGSLIALVTSVPLHKTVPSGFKSIDTSGITAQHAFSSSQLSPFSKQYHVKQRYIAPVSIYTYPKSDAILLAIVDLPAAAGPSIATEILILYPPNIYSP